jgi:hypothetical protein
MAYMKRIVCFANSYKNGGCCIAGRDMSGGAWIRPVSNLPSQELEYPDYCYAGDKIPRLLDVIDIPLLNSVPHQHQTENHLISKERWVRRGTWPRGQVEQFLDQPESLWANGESTKCGGQNNCLSPELAAKYACSLLLITTKILTVEVGTTTRSGPSKTYRGRFTYNNIDYCFKITDPVFRARFRNKDPGQYESNRRVYLCLSLTEPYQGDGRCHKLIAGVVTDERN